jgi:hypothetical protein
VREAARKAYERGRLRRALTRGAAAFGLALPGFLACGRTPLAAACLGGFVVVVVTGYRRGEGLEEGVRAGVVAGILPCLLPAGLRVINADLCDLLFARGPWLCALGGIAAGAILGLRSRSGDGKPFWIGAAATLAFAAALGCIPAGEMGFLGLLAGVVAGGLPALVVRRASA